LQQLVEQRAVVDHGLAKIFGAGLASVMTESDVVSGTIVVDYNRVVDGDIVGAMYKVSHGITTGFHEFVEQLVGA
jgi:hypothetical protein